MQHIKIITVILCFSFFLPTSATAQSRFEIADKGDQEYAAEQIEKKDNREKWLEDKIQRDRTICKMEEAIDYSKQVLQKIDCAMDTSLQKCIFWVTEIKRNNEKIETIQEAITENRNKNEIEIYKGYIQEYQKKNRDYDTQIKQASCYEKCPILKEKLEKQRYECKKFTTTG